MAQAAAVGGGPGGRSEAEGLARAMTAELQARAMTDPNRRAAALTEVAKTLVAGRASPSAPHQRVDGAEELARTITDPGDRRGR